MAIDLSQTPATVATTGTSTTVSTPTGTVAGEFLLGLVNTRNSGGTTVPITPPSGAYGWNTFLETVDALFRVSNTGIYWRWAVQSEPSTHQWTHANADIGCSGIIMRIPGVKRFGNPFTIAGVQSVTHDNVCLLYTSPSPRDA